ncbi:DegT/DnrJ/EryC1/StrS family aminotransferase [Phytohabitans houttuyneae]|uniref:Aminotransferase DegT n=1 Tax=Phytohabitans houttuyneae TaxID=1076126 RepID=A0A6V8KDZ8_9ACTN|nr:aminotransferase class I/II-fold pyridoxal phosphate-dependent enzyme [Phytohabitans houttuyneae]GFJ82024.1 aminotransferase DegT [Phytohabitans houttuyneae]
MNTHAALDTAHVIIDATEYAAIRAVLDTRDLSGTASVIADYETALADWFGTNHAVACSSGTAALHLALLAVNVTSGDEVIVAATAPVMTAMPILAVGATPVFADTATPTSFALDLDDIAAKVTERTRAVIAVPMWGYPADGPDLADACHTWGIPLIEDAAQAHGTIVSGRYAGTRATIGTFSTHNRKLICTGEGGFCLTTNPAIARRLSEMRNIGKRPGESFGATFGLNLKLNAIAAALGLTQLSRLATRLEHRRATLNAVTEHLAGVRGLRPFPIRADGEPNGYAAVFTTPGQAEPVALRLAAAGITSDPMRYGYRPLYHTSALARHAPPTPCRNAEQLAATLLTVPCHEGVDPPI